MDSFINTQVLIVGAGPTGLSLAVQLIRYNIDFLIVEKNEGITTLSKALVLQARSLEIFEELGIAEKAITEGRIAKGLKLFNKGKEVMEVNLTGLGEGISQFPFALSLEQSKTEALLADYLAEHQKNILWDTQLSRFEQNRDFVTAYAKNKDSHELKIKAAYLAGCDGAGSVVRHQLGIPLLGTTEPKLFYVADVILKSEAVTNDELYMFMFPKGFILFFPMEGAGHYRIIGTLPDATNFDQTFTFSDVEPIIKATIHSQIEFEALRWFSTYRIHSRKASTFMQKRCFLVGDAAHIHTPAGGQGMNTGIQDGYNLAWKLAFTLRGNLNAEGLNSYDTERSENAVHLLETTDRLFDIMSGVNPFLNFIRLNLVPLILPFLVKNKFINKKIFPLLSETDITYPDSYLTIKSSIGKVKAGDRMHYFVFSDDTPIFYYLADPVFKLLFFGDKEKGAQDQVAVNETILKTFHFPEIPTALFGKEKNFYILLRPDNHISYIGKEIEICRDFFIKILPKTGQQTENV